MALDSATIKELLQKLDIDREAYLTSLTKAHEILARLLPVTNTSRTTFPSGPCSITESSLLEAENPQKGSIFTGEESSDTEDDESLFVQETLTPETFTEEDLRHHLNITTGTNTPGKS